MLTRNLHRRHLEFLSKIGEEDIGEETEKSKVK